MGLFYLLKWKGMLLPLPKSKILDWGTKNSPCKLSINPLKNHWILEIVQIENNPNRTNKNPWI